MSFLDLALVCTVALAGPLLATPRSWHLPVVLGELVAGVVLGATGFGLLHAGDPTFSFLGGCGFVLVMFVAGTHVPVRDPRLRTALRTGIVRAVLVGVVAVALGYVVADVVGTSHAPVYAVMMASSSAAIVLPAVDSLHLTGPDLVDLLPQVAVADSLCIVLLPLVIDTAHVERAALGALAVLAAGGVLYGVLRWVEDRGLRERVHTVSEDRRFAVELRVSLALVFAMAALAVAVHVSLMLAGFVSGLAVAFVGEPRRVAKQLFAVTEGFFGPLFFVWLGASLQLRNLVSHPSMIVLGLCLGAGATLAHLAAVVLRQSAPYSLLATAQLGVPVAAATVGQQLQVLEPGEGAALVLGALLALAVTVVGGSLAAGRKAPEPTSTTTTTTPEPAGG
ncbi:MAG TPA: cation:proton antiporter [Nocardioides sp.]|uniref:cation:proton antiporter n=1 Tax=Nocardioides sp. TaxID=35761 RepID=UPI002E37CC9A|nr:cation:proton antiporter [Nocardioides sp.]HEX3931350.1 cation:proton antiporter [Nocardioides sp.]